MTQSQFDTQLAWMMVNTFYLAGIYEQKQLGRSLTDDEHDGCLKAANKAAQAMRDILKENRHAK
jgi:hypothetical protein